MYAILIAVHKENLIACMYAHSQPSDNTQNFDKVKFKTRQIKKKVDAIRPYGRIASVYKVDYSPVRANSLSI